MISADRSSSVYVFQQNRFWSDEKCRMFREIAENSNVENAGVYRDGKVQLDPNLRKTRRILLDQTLFAEIGKSFLSLKPAIEEYFQLSLQGLQGIQFLQYCAGDYFHVHADEWEQPSDSTRKISIIMFLNSRFGAQASSPQDAGKMPATRNADKMSALRNGNTEPALRNEGGFEGGDVVLYKDADQCRAGNGMHIVPEEGLLIAFSSYTLHEVQEVLTGVRYSLVSWFY